MRMTVLTGLTIAGPLILAAQTACAADTEASLEEDLATITTWWNGDYDNDRQIRQLEASGQPVWRADDSGKGGHIQVTSHYRPVLLPAFGEHVIYVEETKHGDPDKLFRQRIYTLTIDETENLIRVKLWYFKDREKYVGAWRNLTMIQALSPDEMSPLPDNCDLLVSKAGDKFHMPMRNRDCVFGERYFNDQVLLGPDSFWFRDKIVSLKDDVVLETAGNFTYHKLDKAQ